MKNNTSIIWGRKRSKLISLGKIDAISEIAWQTAVSIFAYIIKIIKITLQNQIDIFEDSIVKESNILHIKHILLHDYHSKLL